MLLRPMRNRLILLVSFFPWRALAVEEGTRAFSFPGPPTSWVRADPLFAPHDFYFSKFG